MHRINFYHQSSSPECIIIQCVQRSNRSGLTDDKADERSAIRTGADVARDLRHRTD